MLTRSITRNIIKKYTAFRNEIDERCSEILDYYRDDITCRAGCSSCCTAITVFPVEYYAIAEETCISHEISAPANLSSAACISGSCHCHCCFLKNNRCAIYNSRPLICRTQGLPLLYRDETGENLSLSVCYKNFTLRDDDFSFNTEACLALDKINSKLFRLNTEFINSLDTVNSVPLYSPVCRISLNRLVGHP